MEFELLQELAIETAEIRTLEEVLQRIVNGLTKQRGIALARIWLKGPGDICVKCLMRSECPDQTECLHLTASAGTSTNKDEEDWNSIDGDFRRFPLGVRKIGMIGATGKSILISDIKNESDWISRMSWIEAEGIRSFAGQPLVFRGEVLGVLAIFSRKKLEAQEFNWLKLFASHAAVAIANSRAFSEIDRLREQLRFENEYLREEIKQEGSFVGIIGNSPPLRVILDQITLVARTNANVMILGESGTGKELIARAIHDRSKRASKPLVKVNCASIPHDLFESEFFGHVRGAFTGAIRDRIGRFQLADEGTLFLDEVGEIPIELQSKLLRVLQEGTYERVGEERTRKVNIRLIAATNRDLKNEIASGKFREDLYYRLNVFPMSIPPLRERKEDIPLLIDYFINHSGKGIRCTNMRITNEQMKRLIIYDWPGNVRELENVMERMMILSQCGAQPFNLDQLLPPLNTLDSVKPISETISTSPKFITQDEWDKRERENLLATLEAADWKIYGSGGAADLLGVKPTTLASRLKKMGINKLRG